MIRYKCPNGHIYAIGECGGAMQESQCPECGAKIGGRSHTLTSGNSVAREMDGARFAAWSAEGKKKKKINIFILLKLVIFFVLAANNMANFEL